MFRSRSRIVGLLEESPDQRFLVSRQLLSAFELDHLDQCQGGGHDPELALLRRAARDLIWTYDVPPKDAVHLATALHTEGVVQLDTFDADDPIRLSGKLGEPPLVIGEPPLLQEQLDLLER